MKYTSLILTALLAACPAFPSSARRRPLVAIVPTQYFSADGVSAARLAEGLARRYRSHGYQVVPAARAQAAFRAGGFQRGKNYPDAAVAAFGRRLGAGLVVYPRLMALGLSPARRADQPLKPAAVVHLRVVGARAGGAIYSRQIAYEWIPSPTDTGGGGRLSQPVADAAARRVTDPYFQQVSGSRREHRAAR